MMQAGVSMMFLLLLAVSLRSILHDLTRPLVRQPWADADQAVQRTPAYAIAGATRPVRQAALPMLERAAA